MSSEGTNRLASLAGAATPPGSPDIGILAVLPSTAAIRARLEKLGARILPPRPYLSDRPSRDLHALPAVKTPPPPLLDLSKGDLAVVRMLATLYRGFVELRWPELGACYALSRGDLTKQRMYRTVLEMGTRLDVEKIPPAVWIGFSCDAWREQGITNGPPTLQFVFSQRRLDGGRDWLERMEDRYVGGYAVQSEALLHLFRTYEQMWRHLVREDPQDRPSLIAIVDSYFPGDSYEKMLAQARRGQVQAQQDIGDAVERGAYLWL